MELGLENKIIVVSGGAKGIGEAIVKSLAAEKAVPVIIGRNASDNELAVDRLKKVCPFAYAVTADLSDPDACAKAMQEILSRFPLIHGLVNNAGVNDGVGLEKGDYRSFMASLHKNMVHYYLLAHYALPALKKTKGPIVNITSKTAETGQGNTSAYAAANGGRNALTREWAVELLKYSIRVNAVVVAESWTPAYETWLQTLEAPEKKLKEITDRIPLENRMTRPEEIADMVCFLLSGRSGHTTGQLIHVDGGYVHLDRALINA